MSLVDPSKALRASEELNRRIIEAMPGGIVHVAADGTILTANEEALRILGMSYDSLTERYTQDFETETLWEDGTRCQVQDYPVSKALITGLAQPPETIGVQRPDGTVAWAIFTAVPVHSPIDGATTGAVVTFLDITDRKRREVERIELDRRLMISERMASIGTLAAGVAHEINNPLSYLLLSLDAIDIEYGGLSPGLKARLSEAIDGAIRIRDIVRDLGTHSVFNPSDESCQVEEVIHSSLRMSGSKLRERATIRFELGSLPVVRANRSKLGQVFLNLIVNALQAMSAKDAGDNLLTIAAHLADDNVVVRICDTGPGIPPHMIERVFEPFVTTKEVGQGSGLGLYISHQIIKSIGGELWAQSDGETGTTMHVVLPVATETTDPPAPSEPITLTPVRKRLLVIDDEDVLRTLISALLPEYEVIEADSGSKGIDLLARSDFNAVLCDLIMPGGTGMEVHLWLQEHRPELLPHTMFMTGAAYTTQASALLAIPGVRCLNKPFSRATLRSTVQELLKQGV